MSAISIERREPRFLTRTRVRLHVFDGTSGNLTLGQIAEAETRDFSPRGVFLAGVDTTAMLVANRRHAAVLESIVPLLGFTNTAKGLEGSVGVAGRF